MHNYERILLILAVYEQNRATSFLLWIVEISSNNRIVPTGTFKLITKLLPRF